MYITKKDIVIKETNSTLSDKFFVKNKHKYISIGFGIGASYGGTIGLRFQQRIGGKIGFGYHAGIGYFLIDPELHLSTVAYALGIKFFWFKGMYLDIQYDLNSGYYFNEDSNGAVQNLTIYNGISYLVGGDWFFNKYFGMNAAIGINQILNNEKDIWPQLDLGFIFKFK